MTQSTNEAKPIYEAYVTSVVKEDFGKPMAKRMTIVVYRGASRNRAVTAYKSVRTSTAVNAVVVETGWRVIERGEN